MNIRYYIDAETGSPHMLRHGVAEREVEQVLSRPAEERPGRDGARVAIGRTLAGRHLRVVYVVESDSSVFVITAFELRRMPLTAFKRRMRRRKR